MRVARGVRVIVRVVVPAIALLALPATAQARGGGHHGLFGGGRHSHSINVWRGSRRLKLR